MKKQKSVYILYEKYQEYQVDKTLKKRILAIIQPGKDFLCSLFDFQSKNNIDATEIIVYSGYDNIERSELKYSLEKIETI